MQIGWVKVSTSAKQMTEFGDGRKQARRKIRIGKASGKTKCGPQWVQTARRCHFTQPTQFHLCRQIALDCSARQHGALGRNENMESSSRGTLDKAQGNE